ncbi:MAG: DUF2442 domain-containing protein [Lachnospiraceae bacterium]|nr:DUF2442 domain-containing protein [Lachnospiraceae bacterium]
MYIKNDVCYAGEPESDIEVLNAKLIGDGMMLVEFSTGEKRLFDAREQTGSAFQPLYDDRVLGDFRIIHGFIAWNDGDIDIAPETLYAESYPYEDYGPEVKAAG